jgi:DNA-binding MarR family transcriptional regulator
MKPVTYPRPGSNAERVLEYIQNHDGTTKNQIIGALKMNPSVVRGAVQMLVQKGLVTDRPDENRHHHYSAKVPVL